MGIRINIGAGGQILPGYFNFDKNTMYGAAYLDFDEEKFDRFEDGAAEEIICRGCLNEFKMNVVETMNEFWRVLQPGGRLEIVVAVVDNGTGAFRDPVAQRYLNSGWADYFNVDSGGRYAGGVGLGFKGAFRIVSNEVGGERHEVVFEALK
jgi:predicted SAM-dependent methyltransferase